MKAEDLKTLVVNALDDFKARDITVLDVRGQSAVTDFMVIASGTSNRHVKHLAEHVVVQAKHAHVEPLGVEGKETHEWVLVDLCDVVAHVMLPQTRTYYDLERLWGQTGPRVELEEVLAG